MENQLLIQLEQILKDISLYEKKGLDSSSLKIFIKNFRNFLNLHPELFVDRSMSFEDKFLIIKEFLDDRKAFPTIDSVIEFANDKLGLNFLNQKESRKTTIDRILKRMMATPELKDKLKSAVISIRNEKAHNNHQKQSKKDILSAETFNNWAEIIKNI